MSASIFKALSDPSRLKVLRLLANPPANGCAATGSVCACDLEGHLGLSQPTVSHHMRYWYRPDWSPPLNAASGWITS